MRQGHQSWIFQNHPVILSTATVVGPEEGNGPLGDVFDIVHDDMRLQQKSWEKAEQMMLEESANLAIENAGLTKEQIHFMIGGDLLNQITSHSFAARTLSIPYFGIFSACATSMEGLALAAQMVDSGAADYILTGSCSHNSTAEKQFRYPTEYGSQKPPTAQFTVTGAGTAVVAKEGEGPILTSATIGRIVDMGIKDPFNMGAAMAPAALDTIQAHLRDLNRTPEEYDLIVTGDLAAVGSDILRDLFAKHGLPVKQGQHQDCGLLVYDREVQPVMAGGSGTACCSVVTYGHLVKQLAAGKLNRVLVVATGALLSPLSYQQGESIPCIAHAVCIERGEDS